jgi:hypothetical protein
LSTEKLEGGRSCGRREGREGGRREGGGREKLWKEGGREGGRDFKLLCNGD